MLRAGLQILPYPTCSHALNIVFSNKTVYFGECFFSFIFVGSGHRPTTNNAAYKMPIQCVPDSETSRLRHRVTTFLHAQGGGGSFNNRKPIGNLYERLVGVNHGWQSESADGPEGGWSCVF